MQRVVVIDGGTTGRRALRGLRAAGTEAVLLRVGPELLRDRDCRRLDASADAVAILGAIREERADTVWIADLPAALWSDLATRCGALGIEVIGAPSGALTAPAAKIAAVVARDGSGAVRTLVFVERLADGLAEAPAALSPADAKAARESAESFARGIDARGVWFVEGGRAVVAPRPGDEPAAEDASAFDFVDRRLRLQRGEPIPETVAATRVSVCATLVVRAGSRESTVALVELPGGPGLRAEAHVSEGDRVPAGTALPVATLCASGSDREMARRRLRAALDECAILVPDRETNVAALSAFLRDGVPAPPPRPELARIAAAIFEYEAAEALEIERFLAEARRGRPRTDDPAGRTFELTAAGGRERIRVARIGPAGFRVGDRTVHVDVRGPRDCRLTIDGQTRRVLHAHNAAHAIEIDGVAHEVLCDRTGIVAAPMPAVVQAIVVEPGEMVRAGQLLVVLEAMKLEAPVVAPRAGCVRQVLVSPNQQVAAGAALLTVAPEDSVAGEIAEAAAPSAGAREPAAELRRLLLGFDDDGWDADALARALRSPSEEEGELDALCAFGAVAALFRREREGQTRAPLEEMLRYLRTPDARGEGLGAAFLSALDCALDEHGVSRARPSRAVDLALMRLWKARRRVEDLAPAAAALLEKRLGRSRPADERWQRLLDRLIAAARRSLPAVADLARELRFAWFDRPLFQDARDQAIAQAEADLRKLVAGPDADATQRLVDVTWPMATRLIEAMVVAPPGARGRLVEVLVRRYYRVRAVETVVPLTAQGLYGARAEYAHSGRRVRVLACFASTAHVREACRQLARATADSPQDVEIAIELYLCDTTPNVSRDELSARLREALEGAQFSRPLRRVACAVALSGGGDCFTFRPAEKGYAEQRHLRGVHPMLSKRLQIDRLANFELTRLPGAEDVYLFHGRARANKRDERFFALAEVRDLTPVRDEAGRVVHLPQLEHVLHQTFAALRVAQARRSDPERLEWNRALLTIPAPFTLSREETLAIARRLLPEAAGLGLEMVLFSVRVPQPDGSLRDMQIRMFNPDAHGLRVSFDELSTAPLQPLGEYQQRVVQLRRRGLTYPYELIKIFTPSMGGTQTDFPPGEFVEHDLDESGALVPVKRPPGSNTARIVAGVVRNFTPRYPEGITRVTLLGDASRETGAVAEPECRRIIAALDLAEKLRVPVDWFALSAGAQISLEFGTENMDWVARALRRIVEFTQRGGEINVVVCGINVGAQPYWNAEATMLMHTRGILVMAPVSAMVLTGKQALEYSGGVSAEDNQGIGGYDRIMGPNGQAQYWAPDLSAACGILLRHHEHCYVAPGERFPRPAPTGDPADRDVCEAPHPPVVGGFSTVGEIFDPARNPDRKKPFDIRAVMSAVADRDHTPLERWKDWRGGDTGVIWDAHLGGQPVCLIGIESQSVPRSGFVASDGPEAWSGGTLFPQSSKKIARAINSASGNRPVVVLANLSGFDGSPESMRRLQLEYGAEIGRAVVNFDGPIVFCVVSRYHGGAFVVFSRWLRENMEVLAVEGARASVIGGAPAAAVVFAREVESRARKDPAFAGGSAAVRRTIRARKMGELADEYDRVHDIDRARRVGSVERIIKARDLRPSLIEAVQRGMARVKP